MNDQVPTIDELGAWALAYWLDAPIIRIGTNVETREFVAANQAERHGTALNFPFEYVWRYKRLQEHLAQQDAQTARSR